MARAAGAAAAGAVEGGTCFGAHPATASVSRIGIKKTDLRGNGITPQIIPMAVWELDGLRRRHLGPAIGHLPDAAECFADVLQRIGITESQVAFSVAAERRPAQTRHA